MTPKRPLGTTLEHKRVVGVLDFPTLGNFPALDSSPVLMDTC